MMFIAILRDGAKWRLLRMRAVCVAMIVWARRKGAFAHPTNYSNGTLMLLFCSSHSGTGRFLLRMNSGLNSFD